MTACAIEYLTMDCSEHGSFTIVVVEIEVSRRLTSGSRQRGLRYSMSEFNIIPHSTPPLTLFGLFLLRGFGGWSAGQCSKPNLTAIGSQENIEQQGKQVLANVELVLLLNEKGTIAEYRTYPVPFIQVMMYATSVHLSMPVFSYQSPLAFCAGHFILTLLILLLTPCPAPDSPVSDYKSSMRMEYDLGWSDFAFNHRPPHSAWYIEPGAPRLKRASARNAGGI